MKILWVIWCLIRYCLVRSQATKYGEVRKKEQSKHFKCLKPIFVLITINLTKALKNTPF